MNSVIANTVFSTVSTLTAWSILMDIQPSGAKQDIIIISDPKLTILKTQHIILFLDIYRKIQRSNKTLQLHIQHLISDTNDPNKLI